jgi:hypothetical protein
MIERKCFNEENWEWEMFGGELGKCAIGKVTTTMTVNVKTVPWWLFDFFFERPSNVNFLVCMYASERENSAWPPDERSRNVDRGIHK